MLPRRARFALAFAVVLCACSPVATESKPAGVEPVEAHTAPASSVVSSAASAEPQAVSVQPSEPAFSLGCEPVVPSPMPPRVELIRSAGAERWPWACRAIAKLGKPSLRPSGYPTFFVRDRESGACLGLTLEDIGAFIYYAPPGRGEALRAELESVSPVPDCELEIGIDGTGDAPKKVGVRAGTPYEEPSYDLQTFAGARQWFEEHPHEHSAARMLSAYLELAPKERPKDVNAVLARALELELGAFAKIERAWLSKVGVRGYCQRTKQLATLPVDKAHKSRVTDEVRRFCH